MSREDQRQARPEDRLRTLSVLRKTFSPLLSSKGCVRAVAGWWPRFRELHLELQRSEGRSLGAFLRLSLAELRHFPPKGLSDSGLTGWDWVT